jgi:Glucose / Sorbosone dehydrogenase
MNLHQCFSRYGFPAAILLTLWIGARPVDAQTNPINAGSISITLNSFAAIPTTDGAPQDLVTSGDGTGRLFVATRNGKIDILNANGTNGGTFLDMQAAAAGISFYNDSTSEGGFAGLAFSPNYLTSGKFYTAETEKYDGANSVDFSHPELLPNLGGATPNNHIVLREWTVSGNPALATSANTTSRVVMRINHPQGNHQGGSLKFGPDGNLYLGLGDGGGGNDFSGSANSTTDGHTNSTGNAQDTSVVFGKILRINPTASGSAKYTIPAGNLTGAGVLPEIYAYGLRNPYRISFDDRAGGSGALYVGDVGQDNREEIDRISTGGGNYGWVFVEGTRANDANNGSQRTLPGSFSSIAPIGEYTHGDGNSIIGGFVYRGSAIPALVGKYVFGDNGNSRLFYMDANGGTINSLIISAGSATVPGSLFSIGQDASGELYALYANRTILAIVPEPTGLAGIGLVMAVLGRRRARKIAR